MNLRPFDYAWRMILITAYIHVVKIARRIVESWKKWHGLVWLFRRKMVLGYS